MRIIGLLHESATCRSVMRDLVEHVPSALHNFSSLSPGVVLECVCVYYLFTFFSPRPVSSHSYTYEYRRAAAENMSAKQQLQASIR